MASLKSMLNAPSTLKRDLVYFSAALIFVYSQLFQFPLTPIYFEGDSLISVSNAMRMLDGEIMYRDFFHLTPPGAEVVYCTLFSIFGVKIWVLNFVILLLGMGQVWLAWFLSRKLFSGSFVYLPGCILLVVGFRNYGIDGTYRLFSVILVLSAVAVLISKRTARRMMIAGALCGLSSFFVQPRGLAGLFGIGIFIAWENYREGFDLQRLIRCAALVTLPFIFVTLATHSYFAWQGGFENYYFDLVTFLRKHYPNDPLAKSSAYIVSDFPDFAGILKDHSLPGAIFLFIRLVFPVAFYYLLIPWVYILFLIYKWMPKKPSSQEVNENGVMLLCIVGLTLAAAVSAPTAGRLSHVAIPGLVIFVWLIMRLPFSSRIGLLALSLLSLLGISYAVQRQIVAKNYLDMPAGRAAFLSPPVFERYEWIKNNTDEGDIFYEAQHPSFYFPFHLKNPTPMYLIRDSEYTPRFQVDSVVSALEKQPPKLIVWDGNWSKTAETREPGDNLDPLWQFIQKNYYVAKEYDVNGEYNVSGERKVEFWKWKGQNGDQTRP